MSSLLPVYRATIYAPRSVDPTENTVLLPIAGAAHSQPFQIATSEGITGFQPYMGMPTGRRGRIDILAKKTDTGELGFDLIDVRVTPGGSNAIRWGTAFIGTLAQAPTFTKLRCFVEESLDDGVTFNPFFTGRAYMVATKSGSRVMLSIRVRDYGEDLQRFTLFNGMPHASVLANTMPAIVSNTAANPSVVQVAAPYGLTGKFTVTIIGSTDTNINGTFLATAVDATHFSVPVAGAGGTGGSWVLGTNKPSGYAQLMSVLPVGVIHPYGITSLTSELKGVISSIDATNGWATVTVNADQIHLLENTITLTLNQATTPGVPPLLLPGLSQGTVVPTFSGIAYAHLTNLSNSQQGDFLMGYTVFTPKNASASGSGNILNLPGLTQGAVQSIILRPLSLPVGVNTTTGATPLVNGAQAAAPTNATSAINTKGWVISTNKELDQGDIINFAGHSQRYVVTATMNSDGSGNGTVTIKPGLQANIADGEVITVQQQPGRMAIPAVNTPIKFSVTCDMRMADGGSKDQNGNYAPGNILLIGDVHPAQLLRDVLQGYFGRIFRPAIDPISGFPVLGLPNSTNVGDVSYAIPVQDTDPVGDGRHGFTALIADTTFAPFRAPILASMKMNDFIEKYICKPYGIGYYFDQSGRFVPVDMRTPASLTGFPTLTDADVVKADGKPPTWSYDASQAYAQGKITVYGELLLPPAARLQQGDLFPTITSHMVEESAADIVDLAFGNPDISTQQYQIDAKGYRAQPYEVNAAYQGGTAIGDRWTLITQGALNTMRSCGSRPYGNGPITVELPCARTANTTGIFPGSFFIATIPELPSTDINQRGGTRLFCCTERQEDGPRLQFKAVDWGLSVTSATPTLGTPAQLAGDTQHSVTCQVTPNASNEAVDVYVNVTTTSVGTRPVDSDPAWRLVGRYYAQTLVTVRHLPAGSRVWFRARSFPSIRVDVLGIVLNIPLLKLPSAWVYGVSSVDTATLSAPTTLTSSNVAATAFTINWANADPTLYIDLLLASPTTDPPTFIAKLPPGSKTYRILGTVASTTYRVYVRATDNVGGFAQATLDVTTAGSDPVAPTPISIAVALTTTPT